MALLLAACATGEEPQTAEPSPTPTPETTVDDIDWHTYVHATVDILEARWLWRDDVDWDDLRDRYVGDDPEMSQSQAYRALELLTQQFGDPSHTRFANPMVVDRLWTEPHETQTPPPPSGEMIGRIGYLNLPGVNVFTEETYRTYATTALHIIGELDGAEPCAWVVDLRDNTGGHPDPMRVALGTLLGDGTLHSFVGPAVDVDVVYESGEVRYEARGDGRSDGLVEPGDTEHPYVVDMPDDIAVLLADWQHDLDHYEVTDTSLPIAVLISGTTGSAGEMTLVATMGRDHTRSFGQPTNGVPTRVGAAYLADGSVLSFADAAATTVDGRSFDAPIPPDEDVPVEGALDAATQWLTTTSETCG